MHIKKNILFLSLLIILLISSCKIKKQVIFYNEPLEIDLFIGETYLIDPKVENAKNPIFGAEITTMSDDNVINLNNLEVSALNEGIAIVSIKYEDFDPLIITFNVTKAKISEIILPYNEINIPLGEDYKIKYELNPAYYAEVTYTTSSKAIATVSNDGIISPVSVGSCNITLRLKDDFKVFARFKVNVYIPSVTNITSVDEINLGFNETYNLIYQVLPLGANQEVSFTSSNLDVVTVSDDGTLTSIYKGTSIIKIISKENNNIVKEIKVNVDGPDATEIKLSNNVINLKLGEKTNFSYQILPLDACQILNITSNDEEAFLIEDGYIKAIKAGNYNIKFRTLGDDYLEETLLLNVEFEELPVFKYPDSFLLELDINWNYDFDPLFNLEAYDNIDGKLDIEVIGKLDTKTLGDYELNYKIVNSKKEIVYLKRIVHVKWLNKTMVIGHAGSYYGAMNSYEAIYNAATLMHYPAIEIDVKQTKDGKFILSHDPTFGTYNLEDYTWDELKDVEITVTRNAGITGYSKEERTYTTKLCTLETYLNICKTYNIIAVIEIKTSNGISNWTENNNPSGSRMPNLIKEIEDAGMINNTILLSSQEECLYWTRKNGYDFIPCQYLVNNLSDMTYYEKCKKYNLDISTNVRDGIKISDNWLKLYQNAGIKVSTYTFEEYATYEDVQSFINRGVDFVTCDYHDMTLLNFDV